MSPARNSTQLVLPKEERSHGTLTPDNPARLSDTRAPSPAVTRLLRGTPLRVHLPALSRAKTTPTTLRSPAGNRAAPKRINPITSSSPSRPKTTRTGKVRQQFAGCKPMHTKLGTGSAFLGNSPRDAPLLRHPAARLCRWFPRAQTARLLGGYTFGYLQSWGPRRAHSPVGGPRPRPRRRDGSSGKLGSQLRLRLRPQSRPRPQPWLRLGLGPAQDASFVVRGQPLASLPRVPLIRRGLCLKRTSTPGLDAQRRGSGLGDAAGGGSGGGGAAGARGGCPEHSVGTRVGSQLRCNLRSSGPQGISCVEAENARQSRICEMGELESAALNAESQSPLGV